MKEPEKILEAKDICKAYGKNMVLNQVNLTIKSGRDIWTGWRKWCRKK